MSDQNRGWCPVCRRHILLKKDGTLRHHGGPIGTGMFPDYRAYRCQGVGNPPGTEEASEA